MSKKFTRAKGALVRQARGLSMLEYALMALVVLAVFGLAMTFFAGDGGFFRTLTDNISNSFNSNNTP